MSNNLENKIKESFQNREIKPSTNSWELLQVRLEVTEAKKDNRKLYFLAYAAVIIGLLFSAITFLYNNKGIDNNMPTIVRIDETNKVDTIIDTTISDKMEEIVQAPLKQAVSKQKTRINKAQLALQKIPVKAIQITQKEKNIAKNSILVNQTIIANPIEKSIQKVAKRKFFTTDKEIDLLLANVIEKMPKSNIKNISIQENYLQYVVESELETPINNRILKLLKTGVDTVEEYTSNNN